MHSTTLDAAADARRDLALPHPAASPAHADAAPAAFGFDDLALAAPLRDALRAMRHEQPTPVQAQAIEPALRGLDLMVSAPTGSGKTASFVLPALTRVLAVRAARRAAAKGAGAAGAPVLVLTPTRELALQVARSFESHGRFVPGLRVASVVGGVPYAAQIRALAERPDVIVATPGRLIDHLDSGRARLADVGLLVLDEADRMLDLGFVDDIRRLAQALDPARQTLLYSATFAGAVGKLAGSMMREPQRIAVASHTEAHADIEQRLHWADDAAHKDALLDHILAGVDIDQAVVFTSTQLDADALAHRLQQRGHHAAALHGGMPQARRARVLHGLRSRQLRVLVATDVAARGLDVPTISHVVNYGLPTKAEDYVHRIGRTGRAGRAGVAVTLAERRDHGRLAQIQRFTTRTIPAGVIAGLEPRPQPARAAKPPPGRRGGRTRPARPPR